MKEGTRNGIHNSSKNDKARQNSQFAFFLKKGGSDGVKDGSLRTVTLICINHEDVLCGRSLNPQCLL